MQSILRDQPIDRSLKRIEEIDGFGSRIAIREGSSGLVDALTKTNSAC